MQRTQLSSDPYNVIISGVGGQGNVTASRVVGGMLSNLIIREVGPGMLPDESLKLIMCWVGFHLTKQN